MTTTENKAKYRFRKSYTDIGSGADIGSGIGKTCGEPGNIGCLIRVPTRTGKPGKMGRHFPVREF